MALSLVVSSAGTVGLAGIANAAPLSPPAVAALDLDPTTIVSTQFDTDARGLAVGSSPIAGFPSQGSDYLVLSTGDASQLPGEPGAFVSTTLGGGGADGNDLTQARLTLRPPSGATCLGFDFSFLSEEYPEFVGSQYNDIFTAELNDSVFSIEGGQVVAPNNFAYDTANNPVSINTVFGFAPTSGTTMDGATPALLAITPVETDPDLGTMTLILSIQDLGDSIYDSAAIVDNMRWLYGANCTAGATPLTDTDGDALPDLWETQGIDYDGDGTPELDLPAMGADPAVRDLFVEVDWMVQPPSCILFFCWGGQSFAPQRAALDDVVAAFGAAPIPTRVHIDSGPNSVMNPVTGEQWGSLSRANQVDYSADLGTYNGNLYDWAPFDSIRNASFDVTRADAFHYAVYADQFGNTDFSGISRGIPGGNFLLTDGTFNGGSGFSRTQERGTFMHELGHNLDLYHGGGPTGANQGNPSYQSIMNYYYQLTGIGNTATLDYSRGAPYDDWTNLRFDGGSIGDLGDSAPPVQFTESDSITEQIARDIGALAIPGDGAVAFVGPGMLVSGTGARQLLFDITNPSTADATYTVTVSGVPGGSAVAITVVAGATGRAAVAVDTSALTPGAYPFAAVLSSDLGGDQLSTVAGELRVADPADPALAEIDAQVAALPSGSGLDPEVATSVRSQIASASNGAPTITDSSAQTTAGVPVGLTFTATDPDGDPLTYAVTTAPGHGTVTGAGPSFTYSPTAGFAGIDTFKVTVSDGRGSTATATGSVTVKAAQTTWQAQIKMRGSTSADLSVGITEPMIVRKGTTLAMKVIGAAGPAALSFVAAGKTSGSIVGVLRVKLSDGKTLDAAVVGKFDAATKTVQGTWFAKSGKGTLTMSLIPPK